MNGQINDLKRGQSRRFPVEEIKYHVIPCRAQSHDRENSPSEESTRLASVGGLSLT